MREIDLRHSFLQNVPDAVRTGLPSESLCYPSRSCKLRLIEMIADLFGISMDSICLGNGTAELIDCLTALHGQKTLIFGPTFFLYKFYLSKYGFSSKEIFWAWKNDDLDVSDQRLTESSLIWVCNPNNPTGHWISDEYLLRLCKSTNGIIAIDESFAIFRDPNIRPAWCRLRADNVVTLRSFSKEYGIPGVRLGIAVGPPKLIAQLEATMEPFSVNATALNLRTKVLQSRSLYKDSILEVIQTREKLVKYLEVLGYELLPSSGNFISVEFKSTTQVVKALRILQENGVLCSSFGDWEFVSNEDPFIRVVVPGTDDYSYVIEAFSKLKKLL